jgi:hypothetical protein
VRGRGDSGQAGQEDPQQGPQQQEPDTLVQPSSWVGVGGGGVGCTGSPSVADEVTQGSDRFQTLSACLF